MIKLIAHSVLVGYQYHAIPTSELLKYRVSNSVVKITFFFFISNIVVSSKYYYQPTQPLRQLIVHATCWMPVSNIVTATWHAVPARNCISHIKHHQQLDGNRTTTPSACIALYHYAIPVGYTMVARKRKLKHYTFLLKRWGETLQPESQPLGRRHLEVTHFKWLAPRKKGDEHQGITMEMYPTLFEE